jgi:hypothetical protein
MSPVRIRPVLTAAGVGALLLGLAAPVAAQTAQTAQRARPAVAASRPAVPNPHAPHSAAAVPGLTGAAARREDPPMSASQRFAQLNGASHAAASNGAASNGAAAPLVPAARTPSATASPGLTSWSGAYHGFWDVSPDQTAYGAQATQSLNDVSLPSSSPDTVYSPTLDPSAIDCIEVTTIYNSSGDYVGAWDWCASSPGFDMVAQVDSSFLDDYSTTSGGQAFYSVQDVQTDPTTNSWTAYLYNYSTGEWDTFYTSANTDKLSQSGGGWDADEVYSDYNSATGEGYYCTSMAGATFETEGLQYEFSSGGAWTPATAANSNINIAYPRGLDEACDGLSYSIPTANGTWQVANTTHAADQILGTGSGKCIDTPSSKFANGTKEQIYTCNSTSAQSWTYNADGELTVDGGKYCLDATGYGTTNGTPIQIWTCNGTTNQEWTFSLNGSIVGTGSGLCLNVVNYGTTNGSTLQLWTCENTTNEQWSW